MCLRTDPEKRPECGELLNRMNEWTVDKKGLLEDTNLCEFQKYLSETNGMFLKLYFETKIKMNNKSIELKRKQSSEEIDSKKVKN